MVTSPDIAKLEKKPDRYMVMETDIEIEGRVETVKAEWRCFQSPSFSANAGWYMRWQGDPAVAYVAKAIPSGRFLIMGMGGIYCADSNPVIQHGQNVGLLDTSSSTLEIFFNRAYGKPHDDRIKRSIIRNVSTPEKIGRTPDEIQIATQFLKESRSYASVVVRVWNPGAWERNPLARARIEPLQNVTFASDLDYRAGTNNGYAFGEFSEGDALPPAYAQLPIVDGKLSFTDDFLTMSGRRIFGRTAERGRNFETFAFCYTGHCRELKVASGGGEQMYDPATKRILQIGWPITSIGKNLNQLLE